MCAASPTSASRSRDECARREQAERKCAARAGHRQCRRDAGRNAFPVRRGIRRRAARRSARPRVRSRSTRSTQRLPVSGRIANGPGGQEMLFGAAVVIALVRDRRRRSPTGRSSSRAWRCRPARGSANARRRRRPEGACEIVSPSASVTSTAFVPAAKPVTAPARRSTPSVFAFVTSASIEMPVLDHVRERLALFDLAAEGQESRPHRVVELGIGDDHVEDRLRIRRDRIPDLDRLEQPPRRGGDGRSARVLRLRMRQRRIGDRHRERSPSALTQRDRQRQAGKAGAADHRPRRCLTVRLAMVIGLPCKSRPSIAGWAQTLTYPGPAAMPPPSRTCSTSSISNRSR